MDKKAYETPEAEVMCFGNDDVITTSGTPNTTLPPVQAVLLKDYFRQKAHRMRKILVLFFLLKTSRQFISCNKRRVI